MIEFSTARAIPHTASRAAFPLGGIGTGNVSIGARGEFRDWELDNLPHKRSRNPNTFFAIHASPSGGSPVTRVLEARVTGRRDWDDGSQFAELFGLPRLRSATMRGEYPFVEIAFEDDELPVGVVLSAFTPLIPLDASESGIPAAVLRYTACNNLSKPVAVTIAGSLTHLAGRKSGTRWERIGGPQSVTFREEAGVRGLDFSIDMDPSDPGYGTMSLLTTDESITAMPEWCNNGLVPDGAQLFWDDFSSDGLLQSPLARYADDSPERRALGRTGSLGIVHELAPGETQDFEFVISWSFPNRQWAWYPGFEAQTVGRNYYAARWADAWAAGTYLATKRSGLEAQTRAFHDALYSSDLDPAVLDALSASIATLRSTTCFRFDDGSFFGWEGSMDDQGSCHGTCTHVWSYAQTVAWLFPDLERWARRNEYLREVADDGAMRFRANAYFGGPLWDHQPAVDGQMGSILRVYREWRFSADDEFLRDIWIPLTRTLDFAIEHWDADGDGVLEALMHNTYDIEFEGAEPLSNVMFLAALRAAARMAEHLGDSDRKERYVAIASRAAPAIDAALYNGEFYRQQTSDVNARRYQYGEGVLSDQLLGQFHAHLSGLGFLLPEEHVRRAIRAVFAYNFRPHLTGHASTQRIYALDEEGGLLLASWPYGGRPNLPFYYADEVWTGVEYQVATELIYCGLVEEAKIIVRTLRDRYSGEFRSPWNEIECGNHYARSMAAWGLLIASSCVQWDAPVGALSFDPIREGTYFFSTNTSWGRVTIAGRSLQIAVDYGTLDLTSLTLRGEVLSGPTVLGAGQSAAFLSAVSAIDDGTKPAKEHE